MRTPWPLLFALLALTACERRTSISLEINGYDGDLEGFLYAGPIAGCASPSTLFAGGDAPGGALAEIGLVGESFSGPDLTPGDYTLVLVAQTGCGVVAAGCQRFALPDDAVVRVDVQEVEPGTVWCRAPCTCGGLDAGALDGGAPDAGAPVACDDEGGDCELGEGLVGRCCRGVCAVGDCCDTVGRACADGVCCESLRCAPFDQCTCDMLPDDSVCEESATPGLCNRGSCQVGATTCDDCNAPFTCEASTGCALEVALENFVGPEVRVVDLVWYQLDQEGPAFEAPLGQAQEPIADGAATFALAGAPPEQARACDRAGAVCGPGGCPCIDGAPAIAVAALAGGSRDGVTMQLSLPPVGLDPDLLVVWASEPLDGATISRSEVLSRLGVFPILFESPVPKGFSVWRRVPGAGSFDRSPDPASGALQRCSGCPWPLPPR